MHANNTTHTSKPRGQSLVEFALVLPMLLLLIVGAMDFGLLFSTKITLTNAAREGASYLARNPSETGNLNNVISSEVDNLTGYQVKYDFDVDEKYDIAYVWVEITKSVDLLFGNFLNFGAIPLSSTVRMRLQ